ncbi:MAG: hypothetical protein JWO38_7118 [Gemmataceae bacterium]|nr:hypothetical protein [Gemmataceae bacterium]
MPQSHALPGVPGGARPVDWQSGIDNSLLPFTKAQVARMNFGSPDVRDGGNPIHVREPNACSIRRTWFCAYDQVENFTAYLLGASRVAFSLSKFQPYLSRLSPQYYPGKPRYIAMAVEECRGAQGCGIEGTDGVPVYPAAKLVVRYEQARYIARPDGSQQYEFERYTQKLPSSTEVNYLSLHGSCLNYLVKDGVKALGLGIPRPHLVPVPYSVGFPLSQSLVSWKWWRLPYDAWGPTGNCGLFERVHGNPSLGFLPYIGTVNSEQMMGYQPGQLLFLGVEEELDPDPVTDELVWNLTMKFLAKSTDHNWLFWPDSVSNPSPFSFYFAGRGNTYYDAWTLPDGVALFNARPHTKLWSLERQKLPAPP